MERNDLEFEIGTEGKVIVTDIYPAVDNMVSYLATLFDIEFKCL